jgi:acyl-CoA synthetase (AMP-forming)/AMP-acid ligase II
MSMQLLLTDLLRHSARLFPEKPAIYCGGASRAYGELDARAQRLANALRYHLRLNRDDRFAVLAQNTVEFPEIYFGAAYSGCVCVPINYRLAAREVLEILADSHARALVADPRLAELVEGAVECGYDGPVLWLGPGRDYELMLEAAKPSFARPEAHEPSDVVLQSYTAGTTGMPKGAMLSHRNFVANSWGIIGERSVIREDVCLVASPLCHLGSGSRVITAAHASATLHVLPKFDPEDALGLIAAREVSSAVLQPTLVKMLVDCARDLSIDRVEGFRRLTYGGSPIPLPVLRDAMALLNCEFQHGYGLTEATTNLTYLQPDDHVVDGSVEATRRLESVGRQSMGTEVHVFSDDDVEVIAGQPGEIVARGPNVMEGYWNQPEATAETIRGGWLHTGDVGVMDEAGYLYVVDRKKDMLISGGINVYPREIEIQLEAHPLVDQVAVVARPDERWGEIPMAFVVLTDPGAEPESAKEELTGFCQSQLARYKVPKVFEFVPDLPRNVTGKVLKRELRERAAVAGAAQHKGSA